MSRLFKGLLGGAALLLTSGAIQLASGGDIGSAQTAASPNDFVNRATKSDRASASGMSPARQETLSFKLEGLADTSVLLRILARTGAASHNNGFPQRSAHYGAMHKAHIACEPLVSVLTDIARQLQPGRCIA